MTRKMYGYISNYWNGGKGIVIANNENEAREKVINTYLKKGYSIEELEDMEVWEVNTKSLEDEDTDVLEIWL